MKFDTTLMTLVEKNLKTGSIPMLLGEPGIGKSSWVMQLGELMHTKVFVLACNQLADKADLTGARLVPDLETAETITLPDGTVETNAKEYKQVFYPHAVIAEAINYAESHPRETPILFMDELNRTTPDVTSEALSIPTARSIGTKKLPPNLKVITAGNDKGNITSLDQASISRFVLYHVVPDVQTFLNLDPELNPFVRNVLTNHPETIFCKKIKMSAALNNSADDDDDNDVDIEEIIDDGEEMEQITTPRTITGVSRWLNCFTNQELMELISDTRVVDGEEISVLQEALEGHTGKTNFTAFLLAEIANGIMSTNNQANVPTVGKPACYDDMKKCTDMTSLNLFVQGMSDNDKSGALLYALYENADNRPFIQALAPNITKLTPADTKVLMRLAAADQLDNENKQTLLNTGAPIATTLSIILDQ